MDTPSLLITDDDLDFRETLRGVFEPRGFHTLLAGDGEEALEVIHTTEVHLLLLDMHMPRLSGLETIIRMKDSDCLVPTIIVTAYAEEEARSIETIKDLTRDILIKPFNPAQLLSAVKKIII